MENEKYIISNKKSASPESGDKMKVEINKIVESLSLDEAIMLEKAVGDLRSKMMEQRKSDKSWPEDMEKTIKELYEKVWKIQSLLK